MLQIPGVPIMFISQHQYSIERLPEATIGGGKYSDTEGLVTFYTAVSA